ncbi:HEAT repeat domain-containing protein [Nitrospira sp. NS4]|uniref:HEAT repeat domain-containing protein n=1 Tax=Nitrospira sp. NS4 TaxID=3414498 RepID=UPI003C2C2767
MTRKAPWRSTCEVDWTSSPPGTALNQQDLESADSSSAGEWTEAAFRPLCFSILPGWTQNAAQETPLVLSALAATNNWSWLGNFSECMLPATEEANAFTFLSGYAQVDCEATDTNSSSTAITLQTRTDVASLVENLFRLGRNETFEDGTESLFSQQLIALLSKHGQSALLEIARIIAKEKTDAGVAAEALKWIGRTKHPATHAFRRWILLRGLTSSSAVVREGAILGLAFMKDPAAIPSLKEAFDREQTYELRDDLSHVLQQLHNLL